MLRACKICKDWHDLDADWPQACAGHFAPKGSGIQIIKDIDPFVTAAADKVTGKRAVMGGRAQHREFLRRNGYREVGNDYANATPKPQHIETASKADIRRAIEQVRSKFK